MKKRLTKVLILAFIAFAALSGGGLYAEEGQVSITYLYALSNATGILPVSWAKLSVDKAKDEIYVVSLTKINIFSENGMQIYTFNETGEIGMVNDIAVLSSGDILVLGYRGQTGRTEIIRCDFRGEPVSTIELKSLPAAYADFSPNRIVIQGASLYLADTKNMKVVVTDSAGIFQKGYDINPIIMEQLVEEQAGEKEKEKESQDSGMIGFTVDADGNIFFTNSAIARVYQLTKDGALRSFGQRGSTAGKFGVPADVVTDATGKYILVSDTLRCVVLVFDRNFRFYTEFGFRGYKPSNLIGPMYMAVDSKNKIYVSQLRNRGVNVYQFSVL
jgi:DNA-binding beta-propeller fold protein YncE